MWGSPNLNEVTALKATGSFFDGSNPKSEMLGAGRGDYFLNIAYDGEKLYLEPDIPNGLKEISTSYALLRNGKESKDNEHFLTSILSSNPRMMMGQKASGEVVFIAADGRKLLQKGLTSAEQRKVCLSEGLHLAANNDGGGSVALIANDILLSKCYDGRALGYIWCGYRKWQQNELPVCKQGSKGMWVNLMQRYLTAWGINTDTDGSFGPATKESILAFQRMMKISVDGSCGPKTWQHLISLKKKQPIPDNMIAIDPGHGGAEWGGGSKFGYREKDLNLVESLRLAELLKEYKPFLTRSEDIDVSLRKRGDLIKAGNYKFCLSLHHDNSGTTEKHSGCWIYISIYASESVKKLAACIGAELQKIGIQYKGTRTRTAPGGGDYYGMHQFTGSTGTLIVEPVYMDNPDELSKLNVEIISQAYAMGFEKYIQDHY